MYCTYLKIIGRILMVIMIEKIEITQRFNFKRLNRHYECFTIDFLNNSAYYKISERGSGDKFLSENSLCDDSWVDILVNLRKKMTSEIYRFNFKKANQFLNDFENLKVFDNFISEKFSYFEKIELIYSCNVIIYSSDNYEEYAFKTNFPQNWEKFGELLFDLVGFDVLHIDYQKQLATPLFFMIEKEGVFLDEKLNIKSIEFGHYRTYPYELPNPRLIIDFKNNTINGYIEKQLSNHDKELILHLLEKYHVYLWIFDEYHTKSNTRDPDDLEGYDWYLEIVFENNIIWHLFGYNDYPDTYVHLAREIFEVTGMDLLEINTISSNDIKLFEKFGNEKLID